MTNADIVRDINKATRNGQHAVYAEVMLGMHHSERMRVIKAKQVDSFIKLKALADGAWYWMALDHTYEIS